MNAGRLDRRLTLERATVTRGAGGQPLESWETVATVWASRLEATGTEAFAAEQRTAVQSVTFQIRFRTDVEPAMRLKYRNEVYEILDVAEIGRREGLALTCQVREAKSGGR